MAYRSAVHSAGLACAPFTLTRISVCNAFSSLRIFFIHDYCFYSLRLFLLWRGAKEKGDELKNGTVSVAGIYTVDG